jgi:hypothetical protein
MTTATRPKSDAPPEFVGEWPRLTGNQEPAVESRQPGDESEGDRCAQFGFNLATKFGTKTRCMPWQWSTVRGITSLRSANEWGERIWTHRDVCIEATRQQGKTLIVVLLILFHLFVAPCLGRARPLKIVYTAQRWSTAKDVFNRVVQVIDRVPYLKRQLVANPSTRDNHGEIRVAVERNKDGTPKIIATAEFAPRSQEFGRGVTELDILFIDEAYDVDPGIENDLTGAQSASDNPQTIYLSTAPVFLKHPKCQSLSDLHRMGHRTGVAKSKHLFYRLFAAPAHLARNDPDAWRAAQPSFDVATNEREIESKLDKAKTVVKRMIFDADYLGRGDYAPPEVEDATEIPAEKWIELKAKSAPELVSTPSVVLEREGNGPWVIIAAWRTTVGPILVEVGYCEAADSKTVAARVVTLAGTWNPAAIVVRSGSAAAELVPDLEIAGIEVYLANRTEQAQACGGFLNAALAPNELMHSGQVELDNGVSAAVKHKLPAGGFVWQLIDTASYPALMGASLAHWALVKFGVKPKRKTVAPKSGAQHASRSTEFDVMSASF